MKLKFPILFIIQSIINCFVNLIAIIELTNNYELTIIYSIDLEHNKLKIVYQIVRSKYDL